MCVCVCVCVCVLTRNITQRYETLRELANDALARRWGIAQNKVSGFYLANNAQITPAVAGPCVCLCECECECECE